jgi:hypothetical protein
MIRNRAILNEECVGNTAALQQEILQLRNQIVLMEKQTRRISGSRSTNNSLNTSPHKYTSDNHNFNNFENIPIFTELNINTNVVTEALHRADVAEEQRLRTVEKNTSLENRLKQQEQTLLSMKMKLKFKDAEILRFKKKDKCDGGSGSGGGEVVSKHDYDVKCNELQSEILKYRYSFEEIERRLTRSGSGSGSGSSTSGSGGGNGEESLLVKLWSEPQECLFSSSLHNILLQYQQLQQQQMDKINLIASNKFSELYGITTDEAVTLRARLSASKGDIEKNVLVTKKLNNKIESLESTITTTTIKLQETENQLIKLKEVQLAENVEWEDKLTKIQTDFNSKSQDSIRIQSQINDNEESLTLQQQQQQQIHQDQYNKLMKDNVVLLKKGRELQDNLNNYITTGEGLESQVLQHTNTISTLNSLLIDRDNLITTHTNTINEIQVKYDDIVCSKSICDRDNNELKSQIVILQDCISVL